MVKRPLFANQESLPFPVTKGEGVPTEAMHATRKRLGQFFTPSDVAETLVKWVAPQADETILDPSCGDGEFLRCHPKAVGIDLDWGACSDALKNAPQSEVIHSDFFRWAAAADRRFEAVVGNPPFVRYQHFNGEMRKLALRLALRNGARISGLTSTWAPFIVVAASLLKPRGRLAFVVPAEIGHSTYAKPVIEYLVANFSKVHLAAIRTKIFPDLSADAWLLFADGFGGKSATISLATLEEFGPSHRPPALASEVPVAEWRRTGGRLRKYLLPSEVLSLYTRLTESEASLALGKVAKIRIGYVTGDNAFFHLTGKEVEEWAIPRRYVKVALRKGKDLPQMTLTPEHVRSWLADQEEVFLLDLTGEANPPPQVRAYLDSEAGVIARRRYKCRVRKPWYAVPDVTVPDAFISVMSGSESNFAVNEAGCVCTNSILAVYGNSGVDLKAIAAGWLTPLSRLSQELEGHPLGGGLLKIEPGEAQRVVVPVAPMTEIENELLLEGVKVMRRWRHVSVVDRVAKFAA